MPTDDAQLTATGWLSGRLGEVERRVARRLTRIRENRHVRRAGSVLALLAVTFAGASVGLLLAGQTRHDVGPFSAVFAVTPSLTGGTDVQIPPLGSLVLRSHSGPAHLTIRLESLDPKRTLAIASNPRDLGGLDQRAVSDVKRGVTKLVLQAAGAAVLGALALAFIVFRTARRVAICGGLAVVSLLGTGVWAVASFRPTAIEEPSYHGLLANAPAVIGDAHRVAGRFEAYRTELQRLVNNVTKLYSTVNTLPDYSPDPSTIRVLHISDLHLNPSAWTIVKTVATQFNVQVVIDTGDIDDWGTPMEAKFVAPIADLKVPYVFIRGNHDSALIASAVAHEPNARVLENQVTTVDGLTIAGIGDPRFTPDKSTLSTDAAAQQLVKDSGAQLANTIEANSAPVDIALVHDPLAADPLAGDVPLVLAGHVHHRVVTQLNPPSTAGPRTPTLLMVQGSTGGAGLRGLEGEKPTPLEMSVLYFDAHHHLQAYDDITLGGTGQTEVTLQRHIIGEKTAAPQPSDTPTPSAAASAAPH